MQGCDTPATRRQRASHGAKPPPPPVSSALQGPRVRIGCRWVAEARQLHTRKVPRRNKSRPTRTTPRRFGTKLSQHTPSHRMCGTKLSQHTPSHRMCGTKLSQHEPHGPTSGRKLSLFTRNGSIWRFFYMQGEFCTVVTAKKLSRENFVPNGRVGARQQDTRPHPCGGCRRDRCGGHGRVSRHSLAAVPVGGGGARPQYPQTTAAPSPSKFRMQFPHDTNRCTLKNRRISTIRLQHLKYTEGNCMRNWWESGPWGNKQHHADGLARSAAGQRPESGPWGLKQRHAGGLARSAPAQHPLSGWRAALLCHGLGYSPGAPRRPNRTRREWTRGRSTGRRAPWPRSCREP